MRFFDRLKLQRVAAAAKRTGSWTSAYVCVPFVEPLDTFGHDRDWTRVCAWGTFNPLEPTSCELFLVDVPLSHDVLLVLRRKTPFETTGTVYGVLPREVVDNRKRLRSTLDYLFTQNGSAEYPLFKSLPTHVESQREPLKDDQIKELFFLAVQGVSNASLGHTCRLLEKYRHRPWTRVRMELRASLTSDDEGPDHPVPARRPKETEQDPEARRERRALLERWWPLITDATHVGGEQSQMEAAGNNAAALRIQVESWRARAAESPQAGTAVAAELVPS